MAITFRCSCGKSLRVADLAAGHRARCPACSAVLTVPAADLAPANALGAHGLASPVPGERPPDFDSPDPGQTPAPSPGVLPYSSAFPDGIMTTGRTITLLAQTKPWVRFIGVMTFVGAGLLVLAGILMGVLGLMAPAGRRGSPAPIVGLIYLAIYFVMAALYIPAGIYLNRYASHIAGLLARQHASDLEAALEAQRSFWRYVGILIAVVLGIYVLFFVCGVGSMLIFRSRMGLP